MARLFRWTVLAVGLFALNLNLAVSQAWAKEDGKPKPDAKAGETTEKPEPKKATVAEITLRGTYPEGSRSDSLFLEARQSLSKIVDRLDKAAEDKTIRAVLLKFDDLSLGRGKLYELRAAIGRLRKAGKPVYAVLASADSSTYLLASACDEIVLAPSGMLLIPGVRAEVTFYKGLLEKLGIQFEMLQMGKYKGAAEPMTRREMSPPMRENMESLVGSLYNELIETIAKDRKLDKGQVVKLVDQAMFTAGDAFKARLVDQVAYRDDFLEGLQKKLAVDKIDVKTKYKVREATSDLSGLAGFMKLMEMALGGKSTEKDTKARKVAVIYAVGPIMTGKSTSSFFGEQVVGSTTLVEALRSAADDSKVVAIVLRIDSPGGSAVASDLIWHEVVRIKKPVIASMGDVAASGGYYIAMGAKQILAAPGTLTGSIGVVGGKPVLGGLYDKVGLNAEVISRGKNAGLFSSTKPFSPDERNAVQKLMEETYAQFVCKAAQGRKMPREKLQDLAQGRVYSGQQALEAKLVDRLGTLDDAVEAAKKAAGVKTGEKVEIQVLPKPKTLLEQLLEDPSANSGVEGILPEMAKTISQVSFLRRLFAEPTLTLMPYQVDVK
jgi:protease-4